MTAPTLEIESSLWQKGYRSIVGIDEVGRGSWAGPLVVAAVILSPDFEVPQVFGDSKQLKAQQRKKLENFIKKSCKGWAIAEISVSIINKVGIGKATHMAFRKVLRIINPKPDFILMDAFYIKHVNRKNQKALIKGDTKSASIAAASIIAKVHRDNIMRRLHFKYPSYGFGKHKGYGTKIHQGAIKKYGLTKIHRKTYNLGFLQGRTLTEQTEQVSSLII